MRTIEGAEVGRGTAPTTERSGALASRPVTIGVAVAVVAGVVLRFVQRSPLWLDEALSVNIARLPVGDLFEALRHDGHPPLYYLLLHGWIEVFGDGDVAVRALSGVFGVAALPLAWVAGRRLAGPAGARWSLVVVALSPYWVRYASETRMYSLVMLLVLAGYLVLTDALREPRAWRLGVIALISGLLLLTHYWAFYLLAAVGLVLAARWWRQPERRGGTGRVILALAAGALLFLPWLPGFLYQAGHTGTPWGEPFRPAAIVMFTLNDLGGPFASESTVAALLVVVFALLALFVTRTTGPELALDLRTAPVVRWELAVVGLALVAGCLAGYATGGAFQSRYAAVVVPVILLAAAVGLTRLPGVAQAIAGGAYVLLSVAGLAWNGVVYQRTQADDVARAIAERARPGDVVVYCPDQLGPDYSRALQGVDGLVELSYPALGSPERVDWVDYTGRLDAAVPAEVAAEVQARADGHAVFVVWAPGYRTVEDHCEGLVASLGTSTQLVEANDSRFFEPAYLHVAPTAGSRPTAPPVAPDDGEPGTTPGEPQSPLGR